MHANLENRSTLPLLGFWVACTLAILLACCLAPSTAFAHDGSLSSDANVAFTETQDEPLAIQARASSTVYVARTSTSGIYHLSATCSGMSNPRAMTLADAQSAGYRACHVCASGNDSTTYQNMYRCYNPNSGEHFYTASAAERDSLKKAGWNLEGVAWIAPATSSKPVYRLYSGTDHHYTTSAAERNDLVKVGWKYEGIGWYSAESGTALHRLFNPNVNPAAARNNSGSHHYTTSTSERDKLVSVGWRYEGQAWMGAN